MLGRRIDDAVGAERERRLEDRRSEDVVDDERGAGRVRDFRDGGDVDHVERRIGRRFEEECLGVRPHRLAPLVEIGAVDQRRGNAVARQIILHDVAARAEQRLRRDHVVAGLDLAGERQRHRRHAGRGRARRFGAFERRHARLEHRHRRIGEARVLVAGLFVLEAPLGLGGAVVDIALGEKERLGGFAELRAQRAGMDEAGLGTIANWRGRGHGALLGRVKQNKTRPGGNPRAGLTRPRPFSNLFYVAASRPAQMTTGIIIGYSKRRAASIWRRRRSFAQTERKYVDIGVNRVRLPATRHIVTPEATMASHPAQKESAAFASGNLFANEPSESLPASLAPAVDLGTKTGLLPRQRIRAMVHRKMITASEKFENHSFNLPVSISDWDKKRTA